jgi:hypothetical protein
VLVRRRLVGTLNAAMTAFSTVQRSPVLARWARPLAVGLTVLFVAIALALFVSIYAGLAAKGWIGVDFVAYQMFGEHFLATGDPYLPAQYVSPWVGPGNVTNLYPPPAILLFAAFTIIPWPLWWGIPLGITVWILWFWRPAYWSWPVITAICCLVPFLAALSTGNSDLWVMAAIALATRWPAAAWFLIAKPSELPLSLLWFRQRPYWQGFVIATIVSAALLPLWFRWFEVLANYVGAPELTYSIVGWPFVLIPVIGRIASTRANPRA